LVMERIEGQNLEQYLKQQGAISENIALDWLKQLALILDFIHKNNYFHRDIKPSNIMLKPDGELVLIDFGTAREVTETVINGNGRTITRVYSHGYTAPEQIGGRAVPQSDFYALGSTFVHLLTGQSPDQIEAINWRRMTKYKISKSFANLINSLIELDYKKRPKNPKTILKRLHNIKVFRGIPLSILVGSGAIIVGVVITFAIAKSNSVLAKKVCNSILEDRLSCGEEILLSGFTPARSDKQKGAEAFAAGDYTEAANWFDRSWQKERDPETLIYLNNSRINAQKNYQTPTYTIAIATPLDALPDGTFRSGKHVLRGVAQAQTLAIKSGFNLRVLIGDDGNKQEQAKKIANALVHKSEILGVVGHYASDITISTLPIYQQNQLVLISSSSAASQLSLEGNRPNRVFFRTGPTTKIMAQALVDYLMKEVDEKNVAIFYNHHNKFGQSMGKDFNNSLLANNGKIVYDSDSEEMDLASPKFNPQLALKEAQKQGANVLAIFPDGNITPYAFQNGLDLIRENKGNLWVVGVSSLYDHKTLEEVGEYTLNRFVLFGRWHPLSSSNNQFSKEAQSYWKDDLNWQTATAYDATLALITALKKQAIPSRSGVQKILTDPNFETMGATGKISFNGSDRKETLATILKVVPNCSKSGYMFIPVDYTAAICR
jgi:eukaryotic-like serine/threonine-protein kinase